MMMNKPAIEIFPDADSLAVAACRRVLDLAQKSIADRGRFVLSLAGGNTPKKLYQLLAQSDADWSYWQLVYGDERLLTIGHADRNSTMVEQQWLRPLGFPKANHHPVVCQDTAELTAFDYSQYIAPLLPIDLALLGIGEDGHTASLFPGMDACDNIACAINHAPKPPPERISLSYQTLNQARNVCFIATGDSKQQVLTAGLSGDDLPFTRINGREKTWLMTDITLDNMP